MDGRLPPSTHFGRCYLLQGTDCRMNGATSPACDRRVLGRNGMVPAPRYRPRPKGQLGHVSQGGILYPPVTPPRPVIRPVPKGLGKEIGRCLDSRLLP
jgi:hypothetical protein